MMLSDIRYGLRGLLKRPAFALVAIIILALGIGANAAIFTLIDAVLLRPLPVPKPDELVLFTDSTGEGTSTTGSGDLPSGVWRLFSYPSYIYIRDHDHSYQELSAIRSGETSVGVRRSNLVTDQAASRASTHLVSGNYFAVLGVSASRGRVLTNQDDTPAAHPAAVISDGYWKRLNSDPQIVGQEFLLNGTAFTIVGVMPPDFFGERVRRAPDFWVPISFQPQIELRASYLNDKNVLWLNFLGRLKPGVQLQQAETNANLALRQYLTDQSGSQLTPQRQLAIRNTRIQLASGARGISGLRFFYSKALRTLMAIVLMVLLIACANVGNLLLSRAAARHTEMSLRQALGANRMRLIRQMLTESLLLAIIGGVAGIMLAQSAVSFLVTRVAGSSSPLNVAPDSLVLIFTVGISLASGLLFGLAPALSASRMNLTSALKEKIATGRRGRLNLGSMLVVAQVAVSLVLLVGAGLFARSLVNLQQEELGFNREHVLVASVDSRLAGYKPAELPTLYRQLHERVSSLPNVRSATISTYAPMGGNTRMSSISVRGYKAQDGEDLDVQDIRVGPDYSATLGIPLMLGRDVSVQDTPASAKVVVVNHSFAEYFFHGQNPIGHKVNFDGDQGDPKNDLEIIGVIGDAKYDNPREKAVRTIYQPIVQVSDDGAYSAVLQIRTSGDPLNLASSVRAVIAQIDHKIPIGSITSLSLQADEVLREEKLIAQMVSVFGFLALSLACIGLYGIMAHAVVRRTNEIGIRMALGAERRSIIWLVLRESLLMVLIGMAIGIPAALAGARLISSQLFGLNSADPITLVFSALVLALVATLAGYLPARRASRLDPLVALRYE